MTEGECSTLCYAKANFEKIHESVRQQNWDELFSMKHPNGVAQYFQNILISLLHPWVSITSNHSRNRRKQSTWFTSHIIHPLQKK